MKQLMTIFVLSAAILGSFAIPSVAADGWTYGTSENVGVVPADSVSGWTIG